MITEIIPIKGSHAKSYGTGKYSIYEIMNWFLSKEAMTEAKLQRLCYYAQGWSIALNNKKLINGDFYAWAEGPVNPGIKKRLQMFGTGKVKLQEGISNLEKEDQEILECVWNTYGRQDDVSLSTLAQRELPWIAARRSYRNQRKDNSISDKVMHDFYNNLARESISSGMA